MPPTAAPSIAPTEAIPHAPALTPCPTRRPVAAAAAPTPRTHPQHGAGRGNSAHAPSHAPPDGVTGRRHRRANPDGPGPHERARGRDSPRACPRAMPNIARGLHQRGTDAPHRGGQNGRPSRVRRERGARGGSPGGANSREPRCGTRCRAGGDRAQCWAWREDRRAENAAPGALVWAGAIGVGGGGLGGRSRRRAGRETGRAQSSLGRCHAVGRGAGCWGRGDGDRPPCRARREHGRAGDRLGSARCWGPRWGASVPRWWRPRAMLGMARGQARAESWHRARSCGPGPSRLARR